MDIFRSLGLRSFSVTTMLNKVDFSGETNTAVHGLDVDFRATALGAAQMMCYINVGPLSAKSEHH